MANKTSKHAAAISASLIFATASGAVAAQGAAVPLEEVVVTAQKRSETLAEIPMSVTVLSGDALERQQAVTFEDMVSLVPGFSLNSTARGVNRITLRGINTGGVASTVGVYVDDVPFGSSSGLANAAILSGDFDTFDLARLEVLRGPQGTLYGASSLGGVMKYVLNAPNTEKFEGRAQVGIENIAHGDVGYSVTGLINIPLSERAALRASAYYRNSDGWIDSIGNNPIPSLTDPNVNVLNGTRVEDNINSVKSTGARLAALFKLTDSASLTLAAVAQDIDNGSTGVVDADPVTLKPLNDNVRSRYNSDFADIKYRVYSATLDWDFGGASLESITSYAEFSDTFQTDVAANTALLGLPIAPATTLIFGDPVTRPLSAILDQITSTDKFTQELRLVSADNDQFEWLLGVYYTKEDSGIDPQRLQAVEAGTDTLASGIPVLVNAVLTSKFEEKALFANATWHVAPRVELSFGARASQNDQKASQVLEGALLGGTINFDDAKSSESPFTWSISPRFAVNDDVSLYARVATGYRPGGPNVIPPGAPPGTPGSYDSDELTSYEAGVKASLADDRFMIDFAAYLLDWKKVQLLAVVNGVGLNANGGTAESKGFEFAATMRPTDNFTLVLNGAYTDAKLTQDTDPVVGGLDGDPLSYVPEWSLGLDANYGWTMASGAHAWVGGNLGYVGDRPADFNNRTAGGDLRKTDAYTLVNARAGIDFGSWSIELYGKNLSDEEGVSQINAEGALPNNAVGLAMIRPRTVGLAVGVKF
ncbi:MAG: TonB-dependent receptor [Steroidobacteraceae bacterium]